MTKVKVCCISSIQEAEIAILAGAKILGLVGPMPSGPGIITNDQIATIAKATPSQIDTWLLTSETSAHKIIAQHQITKTKSIQFVDRLKEGTYEKLRSALHGVKLIQVLHVNDESSIGTARAIAKYVDYILLDSGNPNADIKIFGGTGKVHNWDISRQIVDSVTIPVFLAGGLDSSNVVEAIRTVTPFGVDLCSGLRTDRKLDSKKLSSFFEKIPMG